MATFDSKTLRDTLEKINASSTEWERYKNVALQILSGAEEGISKEDLKVGKVLISLLPKLAQTDLKKLQLQGNQALAGANMDFQLAKLGLQQAGRVEASREEAKGTVEAIEAREKAATSRVREQTKQELRKAERLPLVTARGEAKAAQFKIESARTGVSPDVLRIVNQVEGTLQGLHRKMNLPPAEVTAPLMKVLEDYKDVPQAKEAAQRVTLLRDQRRASARVAETTKAREFGITNPTILQSAADEASRLGRSLVPQERKIFKMRQDAFQAAEALGYTPGMGEGGVSVTRNVQPGMIRGLLAGDLEKATNEAVRRVASAETPTALTAARTGAQEAIKRAGSAPFKRGALGLGAMALYSLLSRLMSGSKSNELPPALQLQLATQMQQGNREDALAQSLISSRTSDAEMNAAKAQLLQAQLLQMMGGGQRAVA